MIRHLAQILAFYYLMTFSVTNGACPALNQDVNYERHVYGPCCLLKYNGDTVQELCRKYQDFLSCLKPLTEYQSSYDTFESEMRSLNCAGMTPVSAMTTPTYKACDYTKCSSKVVRSTDPYVECRGWREAVYCLDTTTINNPGCSSFRNDIDMHRANANNFIRSKCNAAAGLTSSLVFSLGLGLLTYFLTSLK